MLIFLRTANLVDLQKDILPPSPYTVQANVADF